MSDWSLKSRSVEVYLLLSAESLCADARFVVSKGEEEITRRFNAAFLLNELLS